MNNSVKIIFAFTLGVAAGSVTTWKLIKTKYEQIAKEEIDSVKETYSKKINRDAFFILDEDRVTGSEADENDEEYEDEYDKIISKQSYKNEKGGSESMKNEKPRIIPPEEFGENDDYETISLIYYEDDVLTDDVGDVIYDIENTVGEGYETHFGHYEDDTVFVCNDRLKCYYEILRDYGNYSDLQVN